MKQALFLVILGFFTTAALVAAGPAGPVGPADTGITGHVIITKVLTKKRIAMPAYDSRGVSVDFSKQPVLTDEMSRVVVYLEGSGLQRENPVNVTVAQKNRRFDPEIVAIPVGSTVSFPNADPIFHNVFSLSKVSQFDLGYYSAGQTRVVKFDRAGVVQVYCHIHADMNASILVLPNAAWTRPSADGSFSLAGVPPGSYELVAWHRSAGFFRRHVTVASGQKLSIDVVIPLTEADLKSTAAKQ